MYNIQNPFRQLYTSKFFKIKKIFFLAGLITAFQFLFLMAFSAEITEIDGKKVTVTLDEPAEKGDLFYIMNPKGKKKGILKIKSVNGLNAKGVILKKKGEIEKGWVIQPKAASATQKENSKGTSKFDLVFLLGFSSDTIHLNSPDTTPSKLTGTGNGSRIQIMAAWHLTPSISLLGGLGIMTISGKHSGSETTTINYTNLNGWFRYHFVPSIWAGLGASYLMPSSSKGLDADSPPQSTSAISLGGGYDYHLGHGYIPIIFSYDMLLGASGNLAESIALSVGYGFSF